ncbi:MAG: class I tRNA ligase family protein, partial [Dehalococcoidales bacterium]|nr:class I tRNA ligase family protein [Dehalococcoidales bacterium]
WFYSLHAISTLLFGKPSYKNVICLGLILDAQGEKMSKTRGNVVQPWSIINKYGADPLRWYCLTGAPPGNVRRFDEKMVAEITRQMFLTLWNVYSFFVTYANIDNFNPKTAAPVENLALQQGSGRAELDRWLVSELNQLVIDVDTALAGYDPTEAGRKIEVFVDELSNWYVRRSRRRFWKSESDVDKLSAYTTLYQCLVTLAKLLAPFTPYLAEELYQNLVRSAYPEAPESIHLTDFPAGDEKKIDRQLTDAVHLAIKISSLGRAARSEAKIKVRQPIGEAIVKVASAGERESLKLVIPQILDELNVKGIKVVEKETELGGTDYVSCTEGSYAVAVPLKVSDELKAEGMAREIVHRIQTMRRNSGFEIADHISVFYRGDDYIKSVFAEFADYIEQETLSIDIAALIPAEGVTPETFKLEGHEIELAVEKIKN